MNRLVFRYYSTRGKTLSSEFTAVGCEKATIMAVRTWFYCGVPTRALHDVTFWSFPRPNVWTI